MRYPRFKELAIAKILTYELSISDKWLRSNAQTKFFVEKIGLIDKNDDLWHRGGRRVMCVFCESSGRD